MILCFKKLLQEQKVLAFFSSSKLCMLAPRHEQSSSECMWMSADILWEGQM